MIGKKIDMKKYRGIFFDLFATLVLWHPDKLPKFSYNGKIVPSTMGELKQLVEKLVTDVSFDEFYTAFTLINERNSMHKADHGKEISSLRRFTDILLELGYSPTERTTAIAEQLSLRHMELLSMVVKIPADYDHFLKQLGARYRLAVVSNFDHHPTAHNILKRDGIYHHFHEITISDAHGYRKPHQKIFDDTLQQLALSAEEVLFVGDSWEDDVVGAQQAGIDVAWVNPKRKPHGTTGHRPTYEIDDVLALREILG